MKTIILSILAVILLQSCQKEYKPYSFAEDLSNHLDSLKIEQRLNEREVIEVESVALSVYGNPILTEFFLVEPGSYKSGDIVYLSFSGGVGEKEILKHKGGYKCVVK